MSKTSKEVAPETGAVADSKEKSAAVAETVADPAPKFNPIPPIPKTEPVAATQTSYEFRSRYPKFKLLLRSPRFNERGQMIEPGRKVVFENNVFTTTDSFLARAMREATSFGRDFWEIDTAAVSKAVQNAA